MSAWALEAEYEYEFEDEYEAEAEEFFGWIKKAWNHPKVKQARVIGEFVKNVFLGPRGPAKPDKPVPAIVRPADPRPPMPAPTPTPRPNPPRGNGNSNSNGANGNGRGNGARTTGWGGWGWDGRGRRKGGNGGGALNEFEDEYEYEYEAELEGEAEAELEATLARFGRQAAMAASENEAEAFVGALAPLAARLAPAAARQWAAATPDIVQGLSRAAAYLRRDPSTQPLVGVLPVATARAARRAQAVARQGRPMPPQALVSLVGREAQRIVSNPKQTARALHRVGTGRAC